MSRTAICRCLPNLRALIPGVDTTKLSVCLAEHPDQGYYCSQVKGHDGYHIACSGSIHSLKRWTGNSKCRCLHSEIRCGSCHGAWTCTLKKGHDGAHVACAPTEGGDRHYLDFWGGSIPLGDLDPGSEPIVLLSIQIEDMGTPATEAEW